MVQAPDDDTSADNETPFDLETLLYMPAPPLADLQLVSALTLSYLSINC